VLTVACEAIMMKFGKYLNFDCD